VSRYPKLFHPAFGASSNGLKRKDCAASACWKLRFLHRLGRLKFEGALDHFFAAGLSEDVHLLELTPAIAARTNELPEDFSGDPFDRTIIATAAVLNLTLITTDPAIRDASACAVEYYPFKPRRPKR